MGFLSWLGDIFTPVSNIVDELNTSEEERLVLRNALATIKAGVDTKLLELEKLRIEALSKVQIAEAASDSAFTRMYRPLIITGMFILIVLNYLGVLPIPLPDIFITIFGTSFGVIGVGRTLEKIKRIGT